MPTILFTPKINPSPVLDLSSISKVVSCAESTGPHLPIYPSGLDMELNRPIAVAQSSPKPPILRTQPLTQLSNAHATNHSRHERLIIILAFYL